MILLSFGLRRMLLIIQMVVDESHRSGDGREEESDLSSERWHETTPLSGIDPGAVSLSLSCHDSDISNLNTDNCEAFRPIARVFIIERLSEGPSRFTLDGTY